MKAFISGSTQDHNAFAGGSNEEVEMGHIIALVLPLLRAHGHEIIVGSTVSWQDNVTRGNASGASYYYAIHSNAGGGDGTLVLYHPGSVVGKRMAEKLYARLAPVSVGKDDGVRAADGYGELNGPKMPAIIVEVEFHDNITGANDIKSRHQAYAQAIADGILDEMGRQAATEPVPGPTPGRKTAKLLSNAYLRKGADFEAPSLHNLIKGEVVYVLGVNGKGDGLWRKVETMDGKIGWVHHKILGL
jgi:hypothetical protein